MCRDLRSVWLVAGCARMTLVGSYPLFPLIHSLIGHPCPSPLQRLSHRVGGFDLRVVICVGLVVV